MTKRGVVFVALTLIGAGYFGPWVWHATAGLTMSADDLGEWLKFMPIVQAGQSGIIRELFYTPIWIAAIGVGLFAGRATAIAWKLVLLALSLLIVFTPLPKYPELMMAFKTSEFAPTFWGTIVAMLLSIGLAIFGGRLGDRVDAIAWMGLGLAAAAIAPLHFIKVVPEIDRLYHFAIGWGVFAVVMGGIGLVAIGISMVIDKRRPRKG